MLLHLVQNVRAFIDHLTIFAVLSESAADGVATVTVGTTIIVKWTVGTAAATAANAFRAETKS